MENKESVVSAEDLYKSFMQKENLSSSLSSFVFQAEDFNSKTSDVDIVKSYLCMSGNCKEILQLIKEISSSDSQTAMLIMKMLCHILIRVANDLHAFIAVGTSIVNEILSCGMKSVFNFLKIKQKSSRTKMALHLLSSMVALGGQIAHQVVSKLDFSNLTFTHLLHGKNFSDEEDVRTAFINFIILVMTTCDFSIIRQLVEVKGFLNDVLYGLVSDRAHAIILVLSTFRKLIIESPGFSKTLKLKLFNDHSLKPVIKLYSWKGPVRSKTKKKRKLGEGEQSIAYEASQEEIESVRLNAHQFMLALCSSYKTGIIFYDSSFGSSGKNLNHVLTNILVYMPKPHTNKLASDFIIEVLKTCPDQMVHYLPCLKSSCTPRFSPLWIDAINVIKKIILTQDPVSCLFKNHLRKPVSTLISIAKSLCFPSIITPTEISNSFKNSQLLICYHLCDFLICVLKKIKAIIDFKPDFSKIPYSSADISAFNQSFLTTILQNFTFMKDVEDFWVKLTSTNDESLEEKNSPDLLPPSLFNQLSKILEMIQQFFLVSCHVCQNYDINIPRFFQSLKGCHTLLSREEICNLNIKMVDIISAQGEEVIMLWNKNLIDSPLMVLLDIYLTSPSANMIEDVSKILYKVLVHTKVFEYCPWEIDVWLESMKASKTKHITFVIEFINNAMCILLQNPNLFSDDVIETTFGKSKKISLDVTTMLNDLLSVEKDPILIEDFEESNDTSSRLCFSSLLPAALFTLKSVDHHKRKACQSFVEMVLCHIIHHQQTLEALLPLMQKYKEDISSDLYKYFELLCPSNYEKKVTIKDDDDVPIMCKTDLSEHLKIKFISLHTFQNSSKGCQCDIQCEPENLGYKYKEKVIWQLLTYLEWEITLFLENKIEDNNILNYINLLELLMMSLKKPNVSPDEVMEICESEEIEQENMKYKILEEFLNRPVMLKLFLWIEKVSKPIKNSVKYFIQSASKLTLNVIAEAISYNDSHVYLTKFKDKVIKFHSFYFQTINLPKNLVIYECTDICDIISIFMALLSSEDITHMLEDLLNLERQEVKSENYFSALSLFFKMYLELKDFILLSPNAVNSLFKRYIELSKKQKKILREYIMQIFEKHPVLASVANTDSSCILLKQSASKNFYILGCLIDCNDSLRQAIQSAIIENLEELKNTPDFIYLVSKCILNSTLYDSDDTNFLKSVSLLFWEALTNYLLTDIASPDMLLENAGAGKALQVLFQREILAVKKMSKFFKTNVNALVADVPSPSKMIILLQFMEVLKIFHLKSNKSPILILKIVFHWLIDVITSFQNVSEFNYFPLLYFSHRLLQNVSEVSLNDFVEIDTFFLKVLKVALKHRSIGSQLIKIVTLLCQKSKNSNPSTLSLFNLVTGHSNFFNTMLSQIKENENLKECVTDLLIILVSSDKSICKDNHVGLILSSYTGSLKSVDRKLLHLFKLYSESDVDMLQFSPFLWSKTAVVHYSVMNSGTMHLLKKPKLQDLLSIFTVEMIEATVEKYPLTLKLDPSIQDSNEELMNILELRKIYDLRFFLPLFASVLSPGSFVHLRSFMESKVLMLIFASLSSFDTNTRAAGYYCLTQLYFHLEGANYAEKEIWLCLLDSLRNSITSENPRIPSIVSIFLARVAFIFTKPDHPLYCVLYKFIMVKPSLDISHVPEFYKLFNSLEIEHRVHRMWLLKLLTDGLRSSLDFHICEKRYIFSLLLTHYWSSVSTLEEKVAILDIISAASKIDKCARALCQNSILGWLHSVIEEVSEETVILRSLCSLVKNLWLTTKKLFNQKASENEKDDDDVEDINTKAKSLYTSFPNEFLIVLFCLLKKLKILDTPLVNIYLFTLHDVLTFTRNCDEIQISFNLSLDHLSQILEYWQVILVKEENKDQDKKISNTSDFKASCTYFSKIILLWSDWKTCEEQCYKQHLLLLKSVELMLKFPDMSTFCISDLPVWLYKCFKSDNKHEFVKMLFSSKGEMCLRSILDIFEKSLNVQSQFNNTKNEVQLCNDEKVNVFNPWKKIISHLKKVSKNCNLMPELNIYQQISMIL